MKRHDAIAYFQERLTRCAMDEEALHNLSILYKSMGDMEQYQKFARLTLLTKRGGPAHFNEIGLALMTNGKFDLAYEQFQIAVEIQPSYGPSHLNMSALKARKGEYQTALEHCQQALNFMPNDPAVHRNMAKLLDSLGRTAESRKYNQYVLRLDPNDATTTKRVALQSISRNDTGQATAAYDRYRQLKGEHYDLRF
ncbi:hypothetical protein THRCLA_02155 [Thraustotheca clavata]|uniref:Uncharacterized protein n=1 Tax=Thraustotheca clavata TaxID=74557 RepID=A0A1W0A6C0_9STRA|nr:hypothetical protein THRCLA_02155 [Thraustotheca clavata]